MWNKIKDDSADSSITGVYLTLRNDYIRKALVWFVMVELLPAMYYRNDNGSLVKRTSEDSEVIAQSELDRLIDDARGKTSEGIIPLPDYWSGLVDEKSITVHLTPTNMDQTLVVNSINGLFIQILGNYQLPYHYLVMAERKDVDKLDVETNA